MKKLNKLISLLTAALIVPSMTVLAEDMPDSGQAEQTQEYHDQIVSIYKMLSGFITDNNIDAFPYHDEKCVHIGLYNYNTSVEGLAAIEAFIAENDIDTSLIDINAKIPDPAVKEALDLINEFIEENGLNAHAEIYNNRTDTVFVDIDNWLEQTAVTQAVKVFIEEKGIDKTLVDFMVWDTHDENGVQRGDIDEDGFMSWVDLELLRDLLSTYLDDDILPSVADFNGDGKADKDDITALEEYHRKMESIYPDSTSAPECIFTRSGFSEISVSDNNAVCKSLICGYDYVRKIIVEQTLQKKDTNGKWKNVKTWKKTFNDYKAALKNNAPKLSKGFYRLKTTSVVYSGNDNETVTKYSRKYAVGVSADMGDANGDGKVNVRDCAYIAKMLAKGKSLPAKADYNLDGKKNVRDAAALANDLASK